MMAQWQKYKTKKKRWKRDRELTKWSKNNVGDMWPLNLELESMAWGLPVPQAG